MAQHRAWPSCFCFGTLSADQRRGHARPGRISGLGARGFGPLRRSALAPRGGHPKTCLERQTERDSKKPYAPQIHTLNLKICLERAPNMFMLMEMLPERLHAMQRDQLFRTQSSGKKIETHAKGCCCNGSAS